METGFLAQLTNMKIRYDNILTVLSKVQPMEGDTACETKRLYSSISFFLAAALGIPKVLPSYSNTIGVDLKAALLPPPEPVDRYNVLLSLYHYLAQAVAMTLLARIKPTKAPNSHAVTSSIVCQDTFGANGFKMLEELLKLNVIANGALNEDDFDHRLRIYQPPIGTSRLGVESDLMAIVTEAASNGCTVLPNSMLKHFLRVLRKSNQIGPYVTAPKRLHSRRTKETRKIE